MKNPSIYEITNPDAAPFTIATSEERLKWAMAELIAAGDRGCSPISNPGPRWSAYVHKLRGLGVLIETIHEAHHGRFAGTHARYVLRSHVRPLGKVDDLGSEAA